VNVSPVQIELIPFIERSGHPSAYYVVIRARFIGERLQFFSYLPIVQKKPTNIVDLFLVTYKHFEPFAVTI
jgi:hypothetical protein